MFLMRSRKGTIGIYRGTDPEEIEFFTGFSYYHDVDILMEWIRRELIAA